MKSKKNWYLNKMLSLKERFVVSEKITSEWLEKLRLILREPDSFKKKIRLVVHTGGKELNIFNDNVIELINAFTLLDYYSDYELEYMKRDILGAYLINRVAIKRRKELKIITPDKTLPVLTLSEIFPELGEKISLLTDPERHGHCHRGCIKIAQVLNKKDLNIVTGTIYVIHPMQETLHTWIETNINGSDLVFDHNFNAIFKKQDYYDLMHASVIQSLPYETVHHDSGIVSQMEAVDPLYLKLYLCSRKEFMGEVCSLKTKRSFEQVSQGGELTC